MLRLVNHAWRARNESRQLGLTNNGCTDSIQDPFMAARRRVDDCRDRQQWHAQSALESGSGGHRTRRGHDCLLGVICHVHQLALDSLQAATSRRWEDRALPKTRHNELGLIYDV